MATQPNRFNSIIEESIPGFSGLSSSASSLINNLLSGTASTANAKQGAATFGVNSGMPGSGLSNAFGYDLYKRDAAEQKQRGFDDLLKMLTSYSGTVAPTAGETIGEEQSSMEQGFRERESAAAASLAQQQLRAKQTELNKPKWGVVTSGWDAQNGRPSDWWSQSPVSHIN